MASSPAQPKSRADAKLDATVVTDLAFFFGPNRAKKHKAAILLAEDDLSDREIAAKLKMSRSTLHEWKQESEFQQVMGDYHGSIVAEALKLPIAKRTERVRVLNELHESYLETKHLRGETYKLAADTPEEAARQIFGGGTVPWARTGMYVQQPKISASGKTVVEWAFDSSLDSAIKSTQKQAAQELGQWEDKSSVDVQQTVTTIKIIGED